MTTKESFIYSLKIWLTSWFITPIVLFIILISVEYLSSKVSLYELTLKRDSLLYMNNFELLGLVYLVSFFFSLPYWLLLWFSIKIINQLDTSVRVKKIIVSTVALILLSILFSIFNNGILSVTGFPWYISILFGIWYYKFNMKKSAKSSDISIDEHLIIP